MIDYSQVADNLCPQCGHHEIAEASFRDPGDPLVTIIAFWPIDELNQVGYEDRWVPRCQYYTAARHAHWDVQIVERPDQAKIPRGIPVIGFDEPHHIERQVEDVPASNPPSTRVQELQDFEHPLNATYIIGNTKYQRPSDHFECDYLVGITMDDPEAAEFSSYYGSQIAAILWYDLKLKRHIKAVDDLFRCTQVYDDVTILPDGTRVPTDDG